jgi:hypothetical protein
MLADMEREISLMRAQGASIEEIEEAELELARTKASTAQQTLKDQGKILEAQIKVNKALGISTAEQVKQLEDLKNAAKDTENSLKILELNISGARTKRAEDADKEAQAEKDRQKKAAQDAAKAREEERKRKLAEEQAFAAERERVRRQIEDLSTAAIVDQNERELEQNRIKYERLIADTLANEKLLQSEKDTLVAILKAEGIAKEKAINDAKLAKEKEEELKAEEAKQKALDEYKKLIASQRDLTEFEKRQEKAAADLESEIAILRTLLETKAITQEEFDQLELEAKRKQSEALLQIETDRIKAESDARIAAVAKDIETAAQYAGAVNSLAQSIFTVSNSLGKQDEKSKLERAKRQFKVQKALDIVTAGINGALSITKAIAQFGPPPSPLGIAGIAAAAGVTIASIAAIASKKFEGGESAGTSNPSLTTAVNTPAPSSTPTFNLFGRNAGSTAQQAGETENGSQQNVIRAYVSETDLVETTDRLDKIRTNSEL